MKNYNSTVNDAFDDAGLKCSTQYSIYSITLSDTMPVHSVRCILSRYNKGLTNIVKSKMINLPVTRRPNDMIWNTNITGMSSEVAVAIVGI